MPIMPSFAHRKTLHTSGSDGSFLLNFSVIGQRGQAVGDSWSSAVRGTKIQATSEVRNQPPCMVSAEPARSMSLFRCGRPCGRDQGPRHAVGRPKERSREGLSSEPVEPDMKTAGIARGSWPNCPTREPDWAKPLLRVGRRPTSIKQPRPSRRPPGGSLAWQSRPGHEAGQALAGARTPRSSVESASALVRALYAWVVTGAGWNAWSEPGMAMTACEIRS